MKNKILSILCIFILLTFAFINNKVFAVEITPSALPEEIQNALESNEYYNNPTYDYLVYNYDSNYCICFIEKTDTLKWHVENKPGNGRWFIANEIFTSHEYIYNSSYELQSHTYVEDRDWRTPYRGGFVNSNFCFLVSFDIYTDNTYTDFFFKTPLTEQPETTPEMVQIPAVETVEQIPEAILATLKPIIPVGLVVLSVVLLIYLTRRLICRFS